MVGVATGRPAVVPKSAVETIRASTSTGNAHRSSEPETKKSASSIVAVSSNFPIPTDEIHMKIMMVGDTAVGKSSIVRRIVEDAFTYQENATVGLDFKIRRMLVDKTQVRLQIWDTAGQERFQSITTQYFNRAHGFFLVYDITNERTFKNCDKWMQEIRLKGQSNVEIILLANKGDREQERKVARDTGLEFAKKNGLTLWEISAQSSCQIEQAFLELMRKVIDRRKYQLEEGPKATDSNHTRILLNGPSDKQHFRKRCCV